MHQRLVAMHQPSSIGGPCTYTPTPLSMPQRQNRLQHYAYPDPENHLQRNHLHPALVPEYPVTPLTNDDLLPMMRNCSNHLLAAQAAWQCHALTIGMDQVDVVWKDSFDRTTRLLDSLEEPLHMPTTGRTVVYEWVLVWTVKLDFV